MVENENTTILIVDDNPKNLQVLGNILREKNYDICVATNGVRALQVLDKVTPDLVLLDVMMPEMDGMEACKRIKERPDGKDIPIIFLTAKNELEDIVAGFEVGAVDYVSKPFNSIELLARVSTHLELRKSKLKIERQSNQQKELLHILCHDLLNPMSSTILWIELLGIRPDLLQSKREMVLRVLNNGVEIIDLIRMMLAMEEKDFKLDLRSYKLKDLIDESVLILNSRFESKKVEIIIKVPDDLSVYVEKTSFINSVLNNLLTNALKFSNEGDKVIIEGLVDGDNQANVWVKDQGIGIPKENINTIFSPTSLKSRKGTQGETGTGFGMPLVKKFVEAYEGTIELQSKDKKDGHEDHGTQVVMNLKQSA